jgi:hypothetical protein
MSDVKTKLQQQSTEENLTIAPKKNTDGTRTCYPQMQSSGRMRPKARGLARHGDPPGWLEENDPAGCVFVRDERSMPPALTDFPGLGLIYY